MTPTADAEVVKILNYLADEAGLATMAKYAQSLDALYEHISNYPESCPRRPRLDPEARIGIVSPYVVLYTYSEAYDTATIIRVVHGARRITRKLLRQKTP
ncbi:MAG: type II toxin-antitoxin system RelE/ParE family toxin [Asticcacaulis sp.]